MPANTLLGACPHRLSVNNICWAMFRLKLATLSVEFREECNTNSSLLSILKALYHLGITSAFFDSQEHTICLCVLIWPGSDTKTQIRTRVVRLQRLGTVYAREKVVLGYGKLGFVPPHLCHRLLVRVSDLLLFFLSFIPSFVVPGLTSCSTDTGGYGQI